MPRQHDLVRRGAADRNPLRGLDWENIDGAVVEAGGAVIDAVTQIRDGLIQWIKETTGIDLSGIAEFSDAIFEALASALNLSEGGAAVLALLEGLITLDPRSFLDKLAGLFGGGSGLELPAIFTGLGEMFGGLTPGGQFDASKLIGQLPTAIVSFLRAIFGGLLGNIELGQLWKPLAGQERNWLGTFDDPESVPTGDGFEHDATVGRTRLGSAKLTFDGAEHVRMSDPIDAAPGQQLDLGGYVRFDGYTGTGAPAVGLRALAYNAGDQLIGSQVIGTATPPGATSADFETEMTTSWTAPANAAYVYVRMEGYAAGTAGTAHFDDLWLRKPAQSLPQQWVEGLTGALSNLGDGISDAWNFVQNVIDKFMNGRGILGSLFSLGHFETEVAKVFGPGSAIPGNAIADLGGLLGLLLPKNDHQSLLNRLGGGSGTVVGQLPTLPDIIGAVSSGANGGNLGGGNPLTDLWNNLFGLHQAAQSALTSAAAANTQLASQQQETESGEAGVSYGTTFGGGNEAALGGPWTSSDVVIKNGYAGLRDTATTNGSNYLAKTSNTASRDDYVVAVVLGDQGDAANTRIITRADTAFTAGVYVNINKSGLAIGRWTGSGATLTQWAAVSVNVAGGAAIRVRAVGKQYTVMLNGVDVLSYTDTATTAPFGAAYRSAGFTLGTDTGFFGFRYYSFRLASFMLADYNPPGASTMDSWRLSRASNTDVALSIGAGASGVLPSSFLTTNAFSTGVSVSNLGKGEVTIAKAGHYWISFGAMSHMQSWATDGYPASGSTRSAWTASDWCLYVNGAITSGAIGAGTPFPVYLNAGDVVAPGVVNGGMGTGVGDKNGQTTGAVTPSVWNMNHTDLSGPAHFSGVYMGA